MSEEVETTAAQPVSTNRPSQRPPRIPTLRLLLRRGVPLADPARTGDVTSIATVDDADRVEFDRPSSDTRSAGGQADVPVPATRAKRLTRVVIFSVLPLVAFVLTGAAAYLKYDQSMRASQQTATVESTAAARDIATAMLSYAPDTAEATLTKVADRMSGSFRDSFLSLVKDVVAPGAKQKNISAIATVPALAVTTATPTNATLVLFINQAISVAGGPPTNTTSVVLVTLEKNSSRWTLTGFEPK